MINDPFVCSWKEVVKMKDKVMVKKLRVPLVINHSRMMIHNLKHLFLTLGSPGFFLENLSIFLPISSLSPQFPPQSPKIPPFPLTFPPNMPFNLFSISLYYQGIERR